MREIKFRAWEIDSKRMIYHSYANGIYTSDGTTTPMLYFDGQVGLMSDNDGGKSGLWEHDNASRRNQLIPLQYTGLKDKNGKEIYEGDIIIAFGRRNKPAVVEYRDGGACFKARIDDNNAPPLFMADSLSENTLEVIGNIYENPELLGATTHAD